jgi:hypothetical protein
MTSIFTNTDTVYYQVAKKLPGENVNRDDIHEMCMVAELLYIKDGDLHRQYEDVPVTIDENLNIGALPCNIVRLMEVYDVDQNQIEYQLTATNHIKVREYVPVAYVRYLGLHLDEKGIPVIRTNHIPALVSWCLKEILETKMLMGKANPQLFTLYNQKFSDQITAIKQSATNKDVRHYDEVEVIRYNMIPKPGRKRLFKNIFKDRSYAKFE